MFCFFLLVESSVPLYGTKNSIRRKIHFIKVSHVWEVIEVKEVITPLDRLGS